MSLRSNYISFCQDSQMSPSLHQFGEYDNDAAERAAVSERWRREDAARDAERANTIAKATYAY